MSKKGRAKYTDEFKIDAVKLIIEDGLSHAEDARLFDVTANSIRRLSGN